jgi:hypothetical protein
VHVPTACKKDVELQTHVPLIPENIDVGSEHVQFNLLAMRYAPVGQATHVPLKRTTLLFAQPQVLVTEFQDKLEFKH